MGTCDERRILKIMKLDPENVWPTEVIARMKLLWEGSARPDLYKGDWINEETPDTPDIENWLNIMASDRWDFLVEKVAASSYDDGTPIPGGWKLTEKGKTVNYPVEEC